MTYYEGTTETVLYDLFECGLFAYKPLNDKLENVQVSFIYGDRDWVDSSGAEVLITSKRNKGGTDGEQC